MKKRALKYKDESIREALRKVNNPWDMIAFLFVYRSKEIMFMIILVLLTIIFFPDLVKIIGGIL